MELCTPIEPTSTARHHRRSVCPQFGLFHGDPHPGNIFALADGRIAYVDFGNVAELSQANKETLIDAVVHAVNEDYEEMARDFIKLVRPSPGKLSCTDAACAVYCHASCLVQMAMDGTRLLLALWLLLLGFRSHLDLQGPIPLGEQLLHNP